MKTRELGIGIALTLLVGAGAFVLGSVLGPAQDRAVDLAPNNTFIYGNAFLSPSTSQKMAIRDLLKKFPDGGTPEEAEAALDAFLDDLLKAEGLKWTNDIKPWLGDQLAFFFMAPAAVTGEADGAALIASTDHDAAQAFMEKARAASDSQGPLEEKSHEGVPYQHDDSQNTSYGFVEGFLVIGTEGGFKAAVDASQGKALSDSERYESALEPLPDDYLALFYFDGKPLIDAMGTALPPGFVQNNPLMQASTNAAAGVVYARDDGIVTDVAGALPSGVLGGIGVPTDAGLLPELPGDSWGAFGANDVGRSFQELFNALDSFGMPGMTTGFITAQVKRETGLDLQHDVFSWMGDLGLFVQGTSLRELGGGVVIETKDQHAAGAALLKLQRYLKRQGVPLHPDTVDAALGFAIQNPFMPEPVNFVVGNRRVVITYGRQATVSGLSSATPLSNDSGYKAAVASLGEGFVPGGYFDIQGIIQVVERSLTDMGLAEGEDFTRYQQDVRPNLEPLTHFVFGSKKEGDHVVQRVVIGVK